MHGGRKTLAIFGQKVIGVHIDQPQMNFPEDYTLGAAGKGCSFLEFLHARYNPLNCLSSQTYGAWRPQVGLCPVLSYIFVFVAGWVVVETTIFG